MVKTKKHLAKDLRCQGCNKVKIKKVGTLIKNYLDKIISFFFVAVFLDIELDKARDIYKQNIVMRSYAFVLCFKGRKYCK